MKNSSGRFENLLEFVHPYVIPTTSRVDVLKAVHGPWESAKQFIASTNIAATNVNYNIKIGWERNVYLPIILNTHFPLLDSKSGKAL